MSEMQHRVWIDGTEYARRGQGTSVLVCPVCHQVCDDYHMPGCAQERCPVCGERRTNCTHMWSFTAPIPALAAPPYVTITRVPRLQGYCPLCEILPNFDSTTPETVLHIRIGSTGFHFCDAHWAQVLHALHALSAATPQSDLATTRQNLVAATENMIRVWQDHIGVEDDGRAQDAAQRARQHAELQHSDAYIAAGCPVPSQAATP